MNPESIWRLHSPGVAWPTLALAAVIPPLTSLVWSTALAGWIPLWLGTLAMTLLVYVAFTPMHEAAHGNIGGPDRTFARIDTAIGWVFAWWFAGPFAAFKAIHLRHHGATNQPDRDPDHWVASSNGLTLVLRCLTVLPNYYVGFLRFGRETAYLRRQLRAAAVQASIQLFVLALLVANGLWLEALALWLTPAVLGTALLAFLFDWVPHTPHRETERWKNTRTVLGPGVSILFLCQNYHAVHHLWPRLPFYRYAEVFRSVEDDLRRRGAPIVDLRLIGSRRASRAESSASPEPRGWRPPRTRMSPRPRPPAP